MGSHVTNPTVEVETVASSEIKVGDLYAYRDEDKVPIAVARMGVGPNGGMRGENIATFAVARTKQERKDYAALFVAAPDLLEALIKLDASWTVSFPQGPEIDAPYFGGFGRMSDECRELWREIRAAIAKATGGQS